LKNLKTSFTWDREIKGVDALRRKEKRFQAKPPFGDFAEAHAVIIYAFPRFVNPSARFSFPIFPNRAYFLVFFYRSYQNFVSTTY